MAAAALDLRWWQRHQQWTVATLGSRATESLQEAAARDGPAELWMNWESKGGSEGSRPNGKLFRHR